MAQNKLNDKIKISRDTPLSVLSVHFPTVAEYLTEEYGFHCVNCFLSEFETIEEGAATHGIFGEELESLLDEINQLAKQESQVESSL